MSCKSDQLTTALRFSLLASLGLLPIACGGTFRNNGDDDDDNTSAGTSQGANTGKGGSKPQGGSISRGGTSQGGGSIAFGGTGVVLAGAGGGGGGGGMGVACTSPQLNPATGLVSCEEGYAHRPTTKLCAGSDAGGAPSEGGAGSADPTGLPRVAAAIPCAEDPSACQAFQYGYCGSSDQFGALCESGCSTDQDCGPGAICLCGHPDSPTGGACVSSSCSTDADCEAGYHCATYDAGCGGGYACQTSRDECVTRADCALTEVCEPNATGQLACTPAAVCGRPFLVGNKPRLAPVVARSDWLIGPLVT